MLRPKSASGQQARQSWKAPITSLGSEYVLSLRARNCRTGDVLDEEQAPAAKKEDVFKALGQMVNRFQNRAGESLPQPGEGAESTGRRNHALA